MTSCGDDDDDDNKTEVNNTSIVGTWVADEAASNGDEDEEGWNEITFNADGTFSALENGVVTMNGTYALSGSDLKLAYKEMGVEYVIEKGHVEEEEAFGISVKVLIKESSLVFDGNDKATWTVVTEIESMGMKTSDTEITVLNRKK